jgi:hypothetical protein
MFVAMILGGYARVQRENEDIHGGRVSCLRECKSIFNSDR